MAKSFPSAKLLKNPLSIMRSKDIAAVLREHWLANHENLSSPERFMEDFFAYLEKLSPEDEVSPRKIKKAYNGKLQEYWNRESHPQKPKDMFLELVEKDLSGARALLDFGCGKMAFLKGIARNNKEMERLVGIDLKSSPELSGIDPRIEFGRNLESVGSSSMDAATVKLVFHHLNSIEEAMDVLRSLNRILKPGGKLIVFEESFPEEGYDFSETEKYLARFGMEAAPSTRDFLKLSRENRIKFLFLNDWLMNVQNDYMPWTGLYGSMEEWRLLAESSGFRERDSHFIGAVKHRKRKQGMTAMMVFEK